MIGARSASERHAFVDPQTGRRVVQLTGAAANSYPLYYFTPSITRDSRFLVFHSERSGWVQLYRLDLATGEIGQLTDGRTLESGWAIWCEWHLRGIYNHLSALHPATDEVFYFQEDEIRSTQVATFHNRLVARLPEGHMPIGQSAFTPDGSLFAFVHVDAARYRALLRDREALTNMGLFDWGRDHHRFRDTVPTTCSVVDTATGEVRPVVDTGFHFHHVLFTDDRTLLINHPQGRAGMWTVDIGSGATEHLRPGSAPGAHGADVVHQVVTERGIAYEAVGTTADGTPTAYLGNYDPATATFTEHLLPVSGYVHVGRDPAGRFAFVEHAATTHELLSVHPGPEPAAAAEVRLLRTLRSPFHDHQRHHAHPFLSPDRATLYFTDSSVDGFSQVHALSVGDLVD